jgi:DNA-directed RNA polymerase specialized sigma subunit
VIISYYWSGFYPPSYWTLTIQTGVRDIKRNIFSQIKRDNEELILNNDSSNSNEQYLDNLQDHSVDFVETISKESNNFKGIISDKELLSSIESLTDKQKEVLFLLFIKNINEKSIANDRHVSIQSINKVKLKALNRLRADWGCKHGKCS